MSDITNTYPLIHWYAHNSDTNMSAILQHSIDHTPVGMAQPSPLLQLWINEMYITLPKGRNQCRVESSNGVLAGHLYKINYSLSKSAGLCSNCSKCQCVSCKLCARKPAPVNVSKPIHCVTSCIYVGQCRFPVRVTLIVLEVHTNTCSRCFCRLGCTDCPYFCMFLQLSSFGNFNLHYRTNCLQSFFFYCFPSLSSRKHWNIDHVCLFSTLTNSPFITSLISSTDIN